MIAHDTDLQDWYAAHAALIVWDSCPECGDEFERDGNDRCPICQSDRDVVPAAVDTGMQHGPALDECWCLACLMPSIPTYCPDCQCAIHHANTDYGRCDICNCALQPGDGHPHLCRPCRSRPAIDGDDFSDEDIVRFFSDGPAMHPHGSVSLIGGRPSMTGPWADLNPILPISGGAHDADDISRCPHCGFVYDNELESCDCQNDVSDDANTYVMWVEPADGITNRYVFTDADTGTVIDTITGAYHTDDEITNYARSLAQRHGDIRIEWRQSKTIVAS